MATATKTIFSIAAPASPGGNPRAALRSFQPPRVLQRDRWAADALRVKETEDRLTNLHNSLICAMNQLLDLKDLGTGVHSTRLAEWAIRVAQEMGISESGLHDIEVAALLHDIGKIGVPDSILNKPGRLDNQEFDLMKKHPEYGWAVLRILPGLELASLYVLHHHERVDGKGYPGGLQGNEIPIGARIVCVIDAFDAMVSSRPYRRGLPPEEAIRRLHQDSGTQFDSAVVNAFVPIAEADLQAVFAAAGTVPSSVI